MPKKVFISPANHHKTCLVKGCSEAIHCNMIADALELYLKAAGIGYRRNERENDDSMDITRQSNNYGPDLHFAFHTNAGGGRRCSFYNDGSKVSMGYSEIFAKHYIQVYPYLTKPNAQYPPSTIIENWNELKLTKAPAVYAEQWFHDNGDDSAWGHANIQATARSHAKAICEILGVAFVDIEDGNITITIEEDKMDYRQVQSPDGVLNIRSRPENSGTLVGTYHTGDIIQVLEENASGWCRTDKGWCYGGNGYLVKAEAPVVDGGDMVAVDLPAGTYTMTRSAAAQLKERLNGMGV